MSEENQPENEAITAEDLGVNDPIETTGDNPTPADGIEAAADAAAAEAPEQAAEPEPAEPEPEQAAEPAEKKAAKPKPTKRKRQTAAKHGKDTATNMAHLAAKKAARPEPEPAPPITDEQQAAIDLKKAKRERLREIKAELEALDADRDTLLEEQAELVNPPAAEDSMTFVQRHQQVLARSRELRERRVQDRLKLLAAGAGRSPLDQALASRPRQSMAAADAKADAENTE